MKIILASSSPRRKDLLQKAGIDFIVDASFIDEVMDESLPLLDRLKKLAIDKATPIHNKYSQDVVIGADTVVYCENEIIGKATDADDARNILKKLSQNKHTVYSAVAIYIGHKLYSFVESTDVYFKDISGKIEDYVTSNEWIGKAGAYAIQETACDFVEKIDGDINNVIGLPVDKVLSLLKKEQVIS